MGIAQLEQILQRDDVPSDVIELVIGHLDEIKDLLMRKDERMELATSVTGLGIWDRDIRTGKVDRNEQAAQIYGYDLEEMVTHVEWWESRIHPEDRPNVLKKRNDHLQGITSIYEAEYRLRHKSREWRWISSRGKVVERDEAGNALRITGTLQDITERKQTEKALFESEERYRCLSEASSEGIVIHDQGKIIDVNQVFVKMFGYNYTKILNTNGFDLISPKDREKVRREILSGVETPYEAQGLKKDGTRFLIEVHPRTIPYKGRMVRVAAVRDITEYKKVEEALIDSKQALLDSNKRLLKVQQLAKVGFLDWNLKTDRILLSDEVINLYGLDPAKKWITSDLVAQVVHQDDMNYVQSNLEMALKGIKEYSIDHRVVRPDGTVLWVHTQAELAHDEEGNPQNLLGTVVDITERKKMEEALRESEERLRSFIDSATDPIEIWDSKFNLVECNQAVVDEFPEATQEEDLIGRNILDLIPNLKETGRYDKYLEVIRTGNSFFLDSFSSHPKFGDKHYSVKVFKVGNGLGMINRDITDRENAEKALKESEERLRSFIDSSPDGFALFDSELKLIETNEVYLTRFTSGTKKEMLLGKYLIELSPDVEKTGRYEQYQKVLRTGEPINVEEIFTHPKFGKMVFSLRAFKVGRGLGIIASDVTERKQAEKSLRQSEEKYRSFVENFQGIAFRGYEDFSTDLFSGKVEEVTGYFEDDFLSGKINFSQLIHPEDVPQINADVKAFMSSSMRVTQREYRIIDKNGIIHWIQEYSQKFYDKDKRMGGVYGTLQDTTERKKTEEEILKFKTITDDAGYGVAISDIHGNLLYVNESFMKMHEYTTDEIIDKHLSIFHTKEQMKNVKRLADQLRQKGSYLAEEVWHKRKNNEIFPTLMNGTLISDENGKPQFMAATAIDITKRKQAEEALRESEELFSQFMDHLPAAVFIKDDESKTLFANKYLKDVFGGEKWIGKTAMELFPEEAARKMITDDQKALKEGLQIITEEILDRHNVANTYRTYKFPIKRKNKNSLLGGFAIDITVQEKAEEKLRESEEKLRDFMDSAIDIIQLFDSNLNYIAVNKATEKMLNCSREEIIGKSYLDFFPYLKGTDRLNLYKDVIRTGKPFIREGPVPKFDEKSFLIRAFKVGTGLGMIISDITERKITEGKLRESEEKYRSFVENFQGIAFRGKRDFIPLFFHGNVEEITGYTEEEFIAGKPRWDQVIHPEDLPQFREAHQRMFSIPFFATHQESRIIRKDGQIKWIVEHLQNIVDDSANPIMVQGTIYDITKRKQAEEFMGVQRDLGIALSSTSNLTEALDFILDVTIKIKEIDSGGIYLIDQNTGALYLACHMGLSDGFLETVNPIGVNDPRYKLVMKGDPIYAPFDQVAPSQVDKKQLEERLLSLGIIPVLFEESVIAVLNVASHTHHEFSENTRNSLKAIANQINSVFARIKAEEALRESEQRFRTIFNNANDGILLADPESKKFYTGNDKMCRMLGFSHEELKKLGVMDIHPKEDRTYVIDQFEKQIRGEITLARDISVKRKDGSIFYADINSSPVLLSGKTYLLGIFRDITEQKRAEKTKEDLEEKRSAFVSMTSHELRTPITVIKGYAEFLYKNIENIDSIRKAQAIQSITRNVLRLERLIDGVADITRMEQGLFELNASICDFSKFLKKSAQPYQELYGIKFSIHGTLESESPVFLNIDVDRIRQVLDNLMDNANKHTPEDGTIVLTPTVLSNTIQIAISDTGVGIGLNNLERIFERFVSITTEQASGGTGIGLYISKIICEAHGGTLTAHSEGKNQGATFTIELPRWFEK
ncbi:MAG: PAS domain S-box protein [Candidatus Hodarchaeales archaeon]|jgi:PAS domain S-box-containing protein